MLRLWKASGVGKLLSVPCFVMLNDYLGIVHQGDVMKQFNFRRRDGVELIDAFFADSIENIPESFWRECLWEAIDPPEYWITDELQAEIKRTGWAYVRKSRLIERSKPKPPIAIWR